MDNIIIKDEKIPNILWGINNFRYKLTNNSNYEQLVNFKLSANYLENWNLFSYKKETEIKLQPNEYKKYFVNLFLRPDHGTLIIEISFKIKKNIIYTKELMFKFSPLVKNYNEFYIPEKKICYPPFKTITSAQFYFYYLDTKFFARNIKQIIMRRSFLLRKVKNELNTNFNDKIIYFLYPNEKSKFDISGHKGSGLAYKNTIIESINKSMILSPIHEITHIITNRMGTPPLVFIEGLALYMEEKYDDLGRGKDFLDKTVKRIYYNKRFIPLENLLCYKKIGSIKNKSYSEYIQSGSLVKFLINKLGKKKYFFLFSKLKYSFGINEVNDFNKQIIEKTYKMSIESIEKSWIDNIVK